MAGRVASTPTVGVAGHLRAGHVIAEVAATVRVATAADGLALSRRPWSWKHYGRSASPTEASCRAERHDCSWHASMSRGERRKPLGLLS
jgi:hypothetical protein